MEPTTQSHGSVLPGLVRDALDGAGVDWDGLDGLAVSIGPGSFTGLRIGLSLAKGIAFAGALPIAAVPTLEALAWAADAAPGDVVWAVLDARMREVYAASFERTATGLVRRTADEALPPAALAPRLDASAIVVGDAVAAYPELAAGGARALSFATRCRHFGRGWWGRRGHPGARLRTGVAGRAGPARVTSGTRVDNPFWRILPTTFPRREGVEWREKTRI